MSSSLFANKKMIVGHGCSACWELLHSLGYSAAFKSENVSIDNFTYGDST